jgi:hypothetical protein
MSTFGCLKYIARRQSQAAPRFELRVMDLAFGAGSVPCKQQHTMTAQIEPASRLERFLFVGP